MITMDEALNDLTLFEELNDYHEFILMAQVQRALRNLDDAIKGKEYAQDAVYTALSYIQKSLQQTINEDNKMFTEVEDETKTASLLEDMGCSFGMEQ